MHEEGKNDGKGEAVKNIVYITDDGYVLPTKISIRSVVRNAGDARLAIHIVAVALSDENRRILQALETENVTIRIRDVPHVSDWLPVHHESIPDAALLKPRLQSILPDLERALYVDGDTILHQGFLGIFDVELEEVYAAVVMDMVRMRNDTWYREFGLTSYFNSGVMFLNLKRLRDDRIAERFDIYFQRDDVPKTYFEQCAINAAFGGKVVFMGLQYNCLTAYRSRYGTEEVLAFFQAKADDYESPAILHFASSPKPWVMPNAQDTDIWLKYVPSEDYLPILQRYCDASQKLNVDSMKQRIASLNQKVESLKQRNASLTQKVETLTQKVETLTQKVETLTQKNHSLSEGLESRNASLAAKQERIDKLLAGIERRDVEIATLKGRVAELGEKIKNATQDIGLAGR